MLEARQMPAYASLLTEQEAGSDLQRFGSSRIFAEKLLENLVDLLHAVNP
jgi:hypothetical protein